MIAAAIVVFREVLEAALIVCVILAVVRGVKGAFRMIFAGMGLGVLGSVVVAAGTGALSQAFQGNGQELFGAAVLFSVVGLLAWHIVWMQKHGRELVHDMHVVGADVRDGKRPLFALTTVVALAVLREGSEVVLFLQGMMAAGHAGSVALGFALGLAGGIAAGLVLYMGFVKLPIAQMFKLTNILLSLIAAGMAARGAGKLIQAGYLPSLFDPVWDTSHVVSEESVPGQFLTALVGYMAQPSAMQLLFYGVTVAAIATLAMMQKKKEAVVRA
jgi:high-affinity iron transporter